MPVGKHKLIFCVALVLGGLLLGCVSATNPKLEARRQILMAIYQDTARPMPERVEAFDDLLDTFTSGTREEVIEKYVPYPVFDIKSRFASPEAGDYFQMHMTAPDGSQRWITLHGDKVIEGLGSAKDWPLFYDCEKGPTHLSISREPQTMDFYTNGIPDWNYDLRVPKAKINSAVVKELGDVNGLRVIEARLSLTDIYYSDALMILQEVKQDQFLPVYVQGYNHNVRAPSENKIFKKKTKITIRTGMDYSGTGHLHNRYKIIISPNHDPAVVGSDY